MNANKFLAALIAACGIASTVTVDGNVSLHDWVLIAESFIGAFGVYAISNEPKAPKA